MRYLDLFDNQISKAPILDKNDPDIDWDFLRKLSTNNIGQLISKENLLVFNDKKIEECQSFHVIELAEVDSCHYKICTSCLCGFIGNETTQIHIHSRFGSRENDFFLHYLINRVCQINFLKYQATVDKKSDPIYDYLLYLFPLLLKKAISKGLLKSYVNKHRNDNELKGRIDVARHIKVNTPFIGKVACSTREHSVENEITLLIRAVIEVMERDPVGKELIFSNDKELRNYITLLKGITPSYDRMGLQRIITKAQKARIHPLYTDYIDLKQLCIDILQRRALKASYGNGENKMFGVLFDASWLWEEYIAIVLSKQLEHHTRNNSYKLFLEEDGSHTQTIIPDYMTKDEKIVADTKYIPLSKDQGKRIFASAAMDRYYKTIMYMYRFGSKKGLLIYPDDDEEHKDIHRYERKIEGPLNGSIHEIGLKVTGFDVNDYKSYCEKMAKIESKLAEEIQVLIS